MSQSTNSAHNDNLIKLNWVSSLNKIPQRSFSLRILAPAFLIVCSILR